MKRNEQFTFQLVVDLMGYVMQWFTYYYRKHIKWYAEKLELE